MQNLVTNIDSLSQKESHNAEYFRSAKPNGQIFLLLVKKERKIKAKLRKSL